MTYFNMIQLIESSGIGLVYGLRFYAIGSLDEAEIGNIKIIDSFMLT